MLDWKQNADEVIVKLRAGTGPVRLEEVDAAFTDTDCVLRLPGVVMYPKNRLSFESSDTPTPAYFCHFPQMVGSGVASSLLKYKALAPKCRLARVAFYSWRCPRRCLCSRGPLSW